MIDTKNIIVLPPDALPDIDDLTGDLRLLAEIIGVDKALLVAQHFCGTPIRVGRAQKWIRRHRDRCIRLDSEHLTTIGLARKYGLTDRQIHNINDQAEPNGKQLKLW